MTNSLKLSGHSPTLWAYRVLDSQALATDPPTLGVRYLPGEEEVQEGEGLAVLGAHAHHHHVLPQHTRPLLQPHVVRQPCKAKEGQEGWGLGVGWGRGLEVADSPSTLDPSCSLTLSGSPAGAERGWG